MKLTSDSGDDLPMLSSIPPQRATSPARQTQTHMQFQTVFNSLDLGEKGELRSRLLILSQQSRIGRQVEQNLWNEPRLPEDDAQEIFRSLLTAVKEPGMLKASYIQACQKATLRGDGIRHLQPAVLGRAVTRDVFLANLCRFGLFSSLPRARAWLRRAARLDIPASIAFRDIPLSGPICWATCSAEEGNQSPFVDSSLSADALRDRLGLDPLYLGRPLVLFVYTPQTALQLRFPTVADAQWSAFFRPAPLGDGVRYGLTLPHSEAKGVHPWPEMVHSTVFGDTLVALPEVRL